MRGYRSIQKNKAYRLYVVGSAKKRKVEIRPALLGDYNMTV